MTNNQKQGAWTPPPWSTSDCPVGAEFEVLDREGGYICGVAFDPAGPTFPEALADAHLIAAAPDLAEALERAEVVMSSAREEINRLRQRAKLGAKEPAALNIAVYEARAALAKARGESIPKIGQR